jgi:hypothetical protein
MRLQGGCFVSKSRYFLAVWSVAELVVDQFLIGGDQG